MYICRVEDWIGNGYIGRDTVLPGRAAGGRTGRGLNGNPVQSGGLNRERLYRAGYSPPRAGGGRADQARAEWKPYAGGKFYPSFYRSHRTLFLLCSQSWFNDYNRRLPYEMHLRTPHFLVFPVLNRVKIYCTSYTTILNPQCTSMHLTHLSSKVLGFKTRQNTLLFSFAWFYSCSKKKISMIRISICFCLMNGKVASN